MNSKSSAHLLEIKTTSEHLLYRDGTAIPASGLILLFGARVSTFSTHADKRLFATILNDNST